MLADIKNEYTNTTTDLTGMKRIIREYYEQLRTNKLDKFSETQIIQTDSRRNRKSEQMYKK